MAGVDGKSKTSKGKEEVVLTKYEKRHDEPQEPSAKPQKPDFPKPQPAIEKDTDENSSSNRATAEKFSRVSVKTRVGDIAHCFWKQWKLPRPELLLFIIDMEPSGKKMEDDRLKEDLTTLGEKIKILATTMGKCRGQPALLDLVRQETNHKLPDLSFVVLRSWKDISDKTKEFHMSGKTIPGDENEEVRGDHDFFLMTDDDTQDEASETLLPGIIKFRWQLEEELMWKGTARLPAVYLLVGGEKMSWDYMIAALEKKFPVIVLADSGGLAQNLFELWKVGKVEEEITDDGKRQKRLSVNIVPENILEKFEGFTELSYLLGKFKYIQFYSSENQDSFEDVLYKAFIQAHREKELTELLKKTLDLASRQSGTEFEKARGSGSSKPMDTPMKVLLQALIFDYPDVVESLLGKGLDLQTNFKPSQLNDLYAEAKKSGLLFKLAKSAGKGTEKKVTIADSRRVVHYLLQHSTYPLKCTSGLEDHCSCEGKGEEKCCMPVHQELFLWAVLMGRGKMAEVFWKVMPERMSSALIACALFNAMQKKEEKDENKKLLSANAKRFQEVAKGALDMAYKTDAKATNQLLSLPPQHWTITIFIIIQYLAFDFASNEFVTSEAFSTMMDSVWRGDTEEDTVRKVANSKQNATKCWKMRKFCTSPRMKFILAQISTIAFLLLYAFVILFQTTPQQFTPAEIVLCVWVFTLSVQELFQMFPLEGSRWAWLNVKNYFKEIWNKIDFFSILIFIVGMVLQFVGQKNWEYQGPSPDDVTEDMTTVFHLAHVILSLDFILFMTRLLQVFCMYQNLGPMVTTIFKMLNDLVTFMVILILVCLAYAVTSHAILYPNGQIPFTREKLFEIPGQAFWSIFGDLSIVQTLQVKPVENGEATCSYNRSVVAGGELPACPDSWSRYLVPVLLGFYVMMANVLLINLLIAIFGNTYDNVKKQADVHWRFERFLVIREFQKRTLLPPPLNILSMLYDAAIQKICNSARKEHASATGTSQEILKLEKEIYKFVNDQTTKEDDSSVNAINDMTRSLDYIMSTLWGLERTIQEIRESMPKKTQRRRTVK